jgi:peptidoglycan hydrolase CwlO-like protein
MKLTFATIVRRNLVVLGTIGALLLGAATIHAASLWTAASAPLANPPVSMQSLQDALTREQARSAALQSQLDKLGASSADLQVALQAAKDRITTDAQTADQLRASLAAAADKLKALEASIAKARSAPATTTTTSTSSGSTTTTSSGGEHEGGHDD